MYSQWMIPTQSKIQSVSLDMWANLACFFSIQQFLHPTQCQFFFFFVCLDVIPLFCISLSLIRKLTYSFHWSKRFLLILTDFPFRSCISSCGTIFVANWCMSSFSIKIILQALILIPTSSQIVTQHLLATQ